MRARWFDKLGERRRQQLRHVRRVQEAAEGVLPPRDAMLDARIEQRLEHHVGLPHVVPDLLGPAPIRCHLEFVSRSEEAPSLHAFGVNLAIRLR